MRIVRPKFKTEAEEAAWWDANPEYVLQLFGEAKTEGRLKQGPVVKRTEPKTPVTLRLSQEDLEKARTQAERKGLGYQTYVKMLLHEALAKAEHREMMGAREAA